MISTARRHPDPGHREASAHACRARSFAEPSLRLGVTGLSPVGQDGVHHRAHREPDRPRAHAAAFCRRRAGPHPDSVSCNPSPTTLVPRFDYEAHHADLTAPESHWPDSTRAVSAVAAVTQGASARGRASRRLTGPRTHASGHRRLSRGVAAGPGADRARTTRAGAADALERMAATAGGRRGLRWRWQRRDGAAQAGRGPPRKASRRASPRIFARRGADRLFRLHAGAVPAARRDGRARPC